MKPQLAAFPKCFIDDLCVRRTMTLVEWIELAATLVLQIIPPAPIEKQRCKVSQVVMGSHQGTHLEALPEHFLFIGFPLRFEGGDGSPIRAVARINS